MSNDTFIEMLYDNTKLIDIEIEIINDPNKINQESFAHVCNKCSYNVFKLFVAYGDNLTDDIDKIFYVVCDHNNVDIAKNLIINYDINILKNECSAILILAQHNNHDLLSHILSYYVQHSTNINSLLYNITPNINAKYIIKILINLVPRNILKYYRHNIKQVFKYKLDCVVLLIYSSKPDKLTLNKMFLYACKYGNFTMVSVLKNNVKYSFIKTQHIVIDGVIILLHDDIYEIFKSSDNINRWLATIHSCPSYKLNNTTL
jgi:hypothetical protein